jgi:hypothetical protein
MDSPWAGREEPYPKLDMLPGAYLTTGIIQENPLTESHPTEDTERQAAFFMDLLSHDILNNNQAVLSYLELVLANPNLEPKAKDYAQKAISHVRTSTVLVEQAKNLMTARTADPNSFRPIDLMRSVMLAIKELPRFFPSKQIKVRVVQGPTDAYVIGGALAEGLVLSAFVDIARIDPGNEVAIEVRVIKSENRGRMCWSLVLSDPNAVLQPGMRLEDLSALVSQDNSRMVKMAGFIFAVIATNLIGGEFDTKELAKGTGQGCELVITLVKAGKP